MSEFIDGHGLTFAKFVEGVIPKCISRDSLSFVNPQKSYQVLLVSKIQIPGKLYSQRFDESYLLPIATGLGFSLKKTAKVMALRNAWIAYFQESGISQTLANEIRLIKTNEIVADYIILTSAKWSEHPWMHHAEDFVSLAEDFVSLAEARDDYEWDRWYEDGVRSGEIWFTINEFRCHKGMKVYSSVLEKNADYAAEDVKLAKKKIQELHAEVEMQEAIIREAMKPIRKFQNSERTLDKKAPGRPIIAEQQQRRDIAMKFVEQWVGSLMSTLSITSCGELAKMVCGQKMTWWRWLNKETLPSSISLEPLLNVKIKSGEYQSTKLSDLQTTPALIDLITLVDLV